MCNKDYGEGLKAMMSFSINLFLLHHELFNVIQINRITLWSTP